MTACSAALVSVLREAHTPNAVFSVVREGKELDAQVPLVPLLRYKKAREGETTAYVCENRVCQRPTSDPALFQRQLAKSPQDAAREGVTR